MTAITDRPHALLFDLDGTLVDTAPDLARATNALRVHHGLPHLPYPVIRAQVSNGGNALVTLALGIDLNHGDHPAARAFLLDAYSRELAVESRVFPPLSLLLNYWEGRQQAWGIVTNKPRLYAEPLLEALRLAPCVLVCADDLPVKKPEPEPLWWAASQLDTPPEECWYIGDHLRDIQAARAAGMPAIAVGYGYIGKAEDYRRWPADRWFDTGEDLAAALMD